MAPGLSDGRVSSGALAGFLVTGFLFALLGALLPAWGHHIDSNFTTVGNYFLSLTVGVGTAVALSPRVLKRGPKFILVLGSGLACVTLLFLALFSPPAEAVFRIAGLAGLGMSAALLNTGLFHVISPVYDRNKTMTLTLGGVYFGVGSLLSALLVAGTFYAYTVPSILTLIAAVPGFFAIHFARTRYAVNPAPEAPPLSEALQQTRSFAAVLFALLLFFQFGNEWSIAGWLPLFLTRRLGISPATSLKVLAFYWMTLVVARSLAVVILPRVRHGRLLMGSVVSALFGCLILGFTDNLFGACSGVLFIGLGYASIYPLVAERIQHRFPYYHPGFFNGIFTFAMIGGLLAPATLGYFASMWEIRVVMWLPAMGSFTVFVLLVLLSLEAKVSRR